jgi:hypothetical protein
VRRFALVALGLAASIAAIWSRVIFLGETFVLRDALRFTRPSRAALSAAFAAGHVPEWFDGVGFGVALAANPVHGVPSPLTWLGALSKSPAAFDALTLVQLVILSLGAAALAWRLGAGPSGAFLSGFVVATNGFVVSAVPNGAIPYVTWIPWLALAALLHADGSSRPGAGRRTGAALAAATALQLLSGEPGFVLVAALVALAVVLSAGRPVARLRRLLTPVAGGIALAGVGLLPALLLLRGSARALSPAAGPLKWSLHPARLVECVWPLAFGSEGNESWFVGPALGLPAGDPCYAFSLFLGVPVLVLALAAAREPRVRRLLVGSLGILLLALGSYTPLTGALRALLPPLRWINFPEKFFFGALLIWAVAAGVAFSRAFEDALPARGLVFASLVSSALLAAGGAAVGFFRNRPPTLESWLGRGGAGLYVGEGLALSAAGAGVAAAGAALFALALLLRRRRAPAAIAAALALSSVALPLVLSARALTALAPRALLAATPRLLAALPPAPREGTGPRPRLFVDHENLARPSLETGAQIASATLEALDTNVASLFGFDVVPGFETGESARSRRFWDETVPRMSFPAFASLVGVAYAMLPDPARFAPGFPVLAWRPGWGVVGTGHVRPRAFVAPRSTRAESEDEGLDSLASPGRDGDPARIVVSGAGAESLGFDGPLEPCAPASRRPEEVVVSCRSANGGYAVLLEENVRGWSAELDGVPAAVLTADGLFRAVRVGAGEHRIVFRYRTPGLRAGALVSFVSLLALLAFLAEGAISASRPRG